MNPLLSALLSRRLIDRAGGHRAAVLAEWVQKRKEDSIGSAARAEIVNRRLAALLNHARTHVPRWRAQLSGTGAIDEQNARLILSTLPVMTRAQVQANPGEFTAGNAQGARADATGGSTGTPMCFVVDRETMIARESSLMWADGLAGWNYGERIAMLWGSDRDVKDAMSRGRAALRGWIENRRWYNAFDMGPARMAEFHQDMERFRPHIIVAYAGSIFLFARFLCERGLAPCYPLRGIISSAEMITPVMRTMVERVFQRPVFDRYGNREFGAVAAECGAHSGLHVNEADCLVEVGGADPFHADGPIRVTYLKNWAMPFIRYDTGDLGRILSDQPCGCGRETLRLAPVSGRQSDAIRTAAGKIIHGEYFTHLLYGAAGVREFQFIQEQPHAYCLRVVADTHDEAREGEWRRAILVAVGADAELRIEYVPAIPKLPSGKHKFTVSLVK